MSLEVIDMARDNGLTIITFPPHCSHRLQPLDVSVYGPMKAFYRKAVDEWNISHSGERIIIYNLPGCFARAFDKACTFENVTTGFKETGIFPLNSDIFTEADFLPSTVFLPKHSVAANPNHMESAVSSQAQKRSEPVAPTSSDPEQSLILSVQDETMSEEEEALPST